MATKKVKLKYPADLFVIHETSGGETYLVAHERAENVAVVGETISVACYQYVGMLNVSAKVEVK